ncbi:hypothetical protein ACFSOZ_29350 [Mesorhizobium newzealandense]|uniref:Uncharacterized protein n=1 Tax=Mesorhizobium newzealandense TaxID=1300302 RepID=A0ABW4UJG4_9HYPH
MTTSPTKTAGTDPFSVAEMATGNSALIRAIILFLHFRGVLDDVLLGQLFELTKEDLKSGVYDPSVCVGATRYLDQMLSNMGPTNPNVRGPTDMPN